MGTNTQRNHARHLARKRALQALYQWELSGQDVPEILRQFAEFQDMKKVDADYFDALVRGIPKQCDTLDEHLQQHTDRAVNELDPIERTVLRICCFELKHSLETPYKVAINEALELTKSFGADQGHKFVNGVVDKLARELRPHESH
ncbi:MAG: transcription antitermination factor NusB [Pseudomonadota bacterium]